MAIDIGAIRGGYNIFSQRPLEWYLQNCVVGSIGNNGVLLSHSLHPSSAGQDDVGASADKIRPISIGTGPSLHAWVKFRYIPNMQITQRPFRLTPFGLRESSLGASINCTILSIVFPHARGFDRCLFLLILYYILYSVNPYPMHGEITCMPCTN